MKTIHYKNRCNLCYMLDKESIIYIINKYFDIDIIKNIFSKIIYNIIIKNNNVTFDIFILFLDNYEKIKTIFDINGNLIYKNIFIKPHIYDFNEKNEIYPFFY